MDEKHEFSCPFCGSSDLSAEAIIQGDDDKEDAPFECQVCHTRFAVYLESVPSSTAAKIIKAKKEGLSFTLEDVAALHECFVSEEDIADCMEIQSLIKDKTGKKLKLDICHAIWRARSEEYDATFLSLPHYNQLWDDIRHLFKEEWLDGREDWVVGY